MQLSQVLQTLELPHDGSEITYDEAKAQYRLLIQVWHPDKYAHNDKLLAMSTSKMKEINAAWDILEKHFASGADTAVRSVSVPEVNVDHSRVALRRFIFQQIYGNAGIYYY